MLRVWGEHGVHWEGWCRQTPRTGHELVRLEQERRNKAQVHIFNLHLFSSANTTLKRSRCGIPSNLSDFTQTLTLHFPCLINLPAHHHTDRFKQGPYATLLERLHMLQWRWLGNGFVEDHWGCQWKLLEPPIQHLPVPLPKPGLCELARSTSRGIRSLAMADRAFTVASRRQWTDEQADFMRTCLNGSFCARDKQKIASRQCAWCDSTDSLDHRIWHCPHIAEFRTSMSPSDRQELLALPPSLGGSLKSLRCHWIWN